MPQRRGIRQYSPQINPLAFTTRAVNIIEEDKELSEALKNIKEYSEEDQLVIINQVMKKMYLANGFSNYPIIKTENFLS